MKKVVAAEKKQTKALNAKKAKPVTLEGVAASVDKMDVKTNRIEKAVDNLDVRTGRIEASVDMLGARTGRIEAAVERMERVFGTAFKKLSVKMVGMDGRIEKLDKKLSGRIEGLDNKLSSRIEGLDKRLSSRIEGLDKKLSGRIEGLDKKLSNRIDTLDNKLDKGIEKLDKKIDSAVEGLALMTQRNFADIEKRLGGVEGLLEETVTKKEFNTYAENSGRTTILILSEIETIKHRMDLADEERHRTAIALQSHDVRITRIEELV